jgi:DNA-binding response OmpR family regulator
VALKLRVLLFEDDPSLLLLLSVLIKRQGHEVLEYSTPADSPVAHGKKCICRPGETCADLVITDHLMPEETGLNFIRQKKAIGCMAARKTLLMSGNLTDRETKEALALGCRVFPKPFRSQELMAWIAEVQGTVDPGRKLKQFPLSPG